MPFNDFYEQYRQPLTKEDLEESIKPAEKNLEKMLRDVEEGRLRRAADGEGFINPKEPDVYLPNPITAVHELIARNLAEDQFAGWPAMPEDLDATMRYPGIDPVGKYSVIDMKIAQRMARIEAVLQTRSPDVQAYVRELMGAKDNHNYVRELKNNLSYVSKEHRIFTRASKLCLDPRGRESLQQKVRAMETHLSVTLYDQYLQGMEYAAGVRTGPVPREVQDLYRNEMGMPLNMELIGQAAQMTRGPEKISVEFENLEHKLQQARFANPHNWGKKPGEITAEALELQEVSDAIQPYARATARRVLDPLFRHAEKLDANASINRGDLIIIDGKTVREKMYEDFIAAGRKAEGFAEFYANNYQNAASEYVAAGLMAGKRVEAFVPDKNGRVPNEPTQITKKGYEPKPLQKVVLNAWERYFSKRGFYKEKTAKAAEYQRMMEARERVQATNLKAQAPILKAQATTLKVQWDLSGPANEAMLNPYLRDWTRETGQDRRKLDGGPCKFSVSRSAVTSIAACALLNAGYNMKDIYDKTKLLDQKAAMGKQVLQRMHAGDQQWLGEQMFRGVEMIANALDGIGRTTKLTDPAVLYQEKNGILIFAGQVAFDIFQEKDRVIEGWKAAAERRRPGHGEQVAEEMAGRALSAGLYFDFAKKALDGGVAMVTDLDDGTSLGSIVTFETMRQKNLANPTVPMSRQFDVAIGVKVTGVEAALRGISSNFDALSDRLDSSVEAREAFGLEVLRGQAQERMKITADLEHDRVDFELKEPAKASVKQTENDRQLQETARQNAAKAAKPMGGGFVR